MFISLTAGRVQEVGTTCNAYSLPDSLRCDVRLNQVAQHYLTAALSEKTRSTYRSGFNAFLSFCTMHNIVYRSGNWVGSENLMVKFVCYCAEIKHLSYQTIKSYLAGVKYSCLRDGFPDPLTLKNGQPMMQLGLVLRGIKKEQGSHCSTRLPITTDILTKLHTVLDGRIFGHYEDLLMKAVCSIAFFGFLRCGEFTTTGRFQEQIHLCLGDITLNHRKETQSTFSELILHIKSSKTDPFRQGCDIAYFAVDCCICPVQNMVQYLNQRLLLGTSLCSPLFMMRDGSPLTRCRFLTMLHTACTQAGINSSGFSGHSFRIGAATTCAKNNVPDHMIQALGRWSSDCYKLYVRINKDSIIQAQYNMARGSMNG